MSAARSVSLSPSTRNVYYTRYSCPVLVVVYGTGTDAFVAGMISSAARIDDFQSRIFRILEFGVGILSARERRRLTQHPVYDPFRMYRVQVLK